MDGKLLGDKRPMAAVEPKKRNGYYSKLPDTFIDSKKSYQAVIQTNRGTMRVALFADAAPTTVNNFIYLATEGFFDGTTFHRVIKDFMVQAGDPSGTGTGGPGYRFKDEFHPNHRFTKQGLLAMANAGPGTNGSQFFITHVPTPWLNNKHTIFGEIIEGEDVLFAIRERDPQRDPKPGDEIIRIDIYEM
jgi:cyclophilin family peptidyl-prolyl cis-trans isomerase